MSAEESSSEEASVTAIGARGGVVSRLAPSPTGVLHLGNARTFLLNWLEVRARAGTLHLRIEDIDGPRLRAGAEAAALEDITWLGLDWDGDMLRQSDRTERYRSAVDDLLARGLAYPCVCSRKEVEEAASAPHESWQDTTPYPGTCADRGWQDRDAARAATGREPAVRMRVAESAVAFEDVFRGPQPGSIRGDFVIEKRDGGAAYQCAVVVDDAATNVDLVLRGDDLLASTPRQLLLYAALGLRAPRFAHVPLLVGPDGLRLAKRHGDTSLSAFRRAGVTPEQIVGYLAYTSGLRPQPTPCAAAELLDGFDLARVGREAWTVDDLPFSV